MKREKDMESAVTIRDMRMPPPVATNPNAEILHLGERRVLLSNAGCDIPPLLEPVKGGHLVRAPYHRVMGYNALEEGAGKVDLAISRGLNISTPLFHWPLSIEQMSFNEICSEPSLRLNPKQLGFIPVSEWSSDPTTFGQLVSVFFRKRNSPFCKFPYKLYNALKLSEAYPELRSHLGIEWVTDHVFRVHRVNFARILGVRTIEGGLFHQQGNFPSHGFVELGFAESDQLSREYGFGKCDLCVVRFVRHAQGLFARFSTEANLQHCKWTGT
jgi:hypothetical protein